MRCVLLYRQIQQQWFLVKMLVLEAFFAAQLDYRKNSVRNASSTHHYVNRESQVLYPFPKHTHTYTHTHAHNIQYVDNLL